MTNPIEFTSVNAISLKVYSLQTGKIVIMLHQSGNDNYNETVEGYYFTPGAWQELKFNFHFTSEQNGIYDMISIIIDDDAGNWYFDDIETIMVPPFTHDTISDFDFTVRGFEPLKGIDTSIPAPVVSLDSDPLDVSNGVLSFKTTGDLYEGAICLLEGKLDFTNKNTIALKVYSEVPGPIRVKLMNFADPETNTTVSGYYFTPGEWQEIKFNYYLTSADNNIYDALTLYPDYGQSGDTAWYIDDVAFEYLPPYTDDTISNFDGVIRYFENYTQNTIYFPEQNQYPDEINSSPNCLKLSTDSGLYENIKTTLSSKLDLSIHEYNAINIKVRSNTIGNVFVKIGGPGEVEYHAGTQLYSTPESWQELSFNISEAETNTYNSIYIFPDFEKTGSTNWYFDEIIHDHQIDLNIYSNWEDITLPFIQVGNSTVEQVSNPAAADPLNSSANVLQIVTNSQLNEGAKTELNAYLDFSRSAVFTAKILSSITGTVVMKLEGSGVLSQEVSAIYTNQGQWQLLTFNFGQDILSDVYHEISILPDFGNSTSSAWYLDDLSGPNLVVPVELATTYADWETYSPSLSTWSGLTTSVAANPFVAGINQSPQVLETYTNNNTYEGFAFTLNDIIDLNEGTTFALDVLSDQAGSVTLKLESSYGAIPDQITLEYTIPGSWQQLEFVFDDALPNAFDKIAVFPDHNGSYASQWFFDNIQGPALTEKAICFTATSIPEGGEDGKEIAVTLIGDSFATSLSVSNWVVSGLTGVTVGSVTRISDTLANVILSGNSPGQSPDDIRVTITVDEIEFTSASNHLSGDFTVIALGEFSETRQKRVFVHYMPWYNLEATGDLPAYGAWRNPGDTSQIVYSNEPLIGEYSQLDESVLEYHFLCMHAAGIDGIILNINPTYIRDRILAGSILDKLSKMNDEYAEYGFDLKYIISYDNPDLIPEDYASIYYDLSFVRDSLTHHPTFGEHRFNDDKTGSPVLLTWSHLGDQDTSYHQAIESLYAGNIIHLKRDPVDFTSANGTFQWVDYLTDSITPDDDLYYSYWGEDYFNDFDSCMANQHLQNIPASQRNYLTMGAVWPGFDDQNATWGRDRWINREVNDGETMALTFDRQMNYAPGSFGPVKVEAPWLQVVTWNDWPEGATIEPATEDTYGYKALLTTMGKIADFKGEPEPAGSDSLGVHIPYEIFQARKNENPAYAQCILMEFLTGNVEHALENCGSAYNILLEVPYSQELADSLSGAACIKMILDYEGPTTVTQSMIHTYGVGQNYTLNSGADYLDPYGMYRSLNYFELDSDYNYAQLVRGTRNEAYHDLCYWISNVIPNTPREHLPSVVPVNGGFDDWFVVNGFQASANPQLQSDYTVYGFYVTDPNYSGVGNQMFIQANTFSRYYYQAIVSADIWNGQYVSVNEPPVEPGTVIIEPERKVREPANNDLRFEIVEEALADYELANNDVISKIVSEGIMRDRTYFVDLDGTVNDYYIVSYSRSRLGGCMLVAAIDATTGALKLLSYSEDPDENYYTYLERYTQISKLKSIQAIGKNWNLLYPVKGAISQPVTDVPAIELEITPNPASDIMRIRYDIQAESNVKISIIDMSGRTINTIVNDVHTIGPYEREVNLQGIENGIYIIRLLSKDGFVSKRFIINK
ncbi:MAG: T9SS type A sorting domain-containing protein [Methanosarcinaceae archaeon]